MWDYSDRLKEHFFHPRNVGVIESPDGVGEAGSLACGDALKLMFKLDDEGRMAEVKFQTFGCGSAIASASALTELIKGKTLEEAERLTNQDIVDYLGGMPPEKMHCSVMGHEALEAAIADYRGAHKAPAQEGVVVCKCFGITDHEIKHVVRENKLTTVDEVTNYTKAGGGCGQCRPAIEALVSEVRAETEKPAPRPPSGKKLTNIQKIRLIEETMEREIRPALREDGGDVELVDVVGDKVLVAMRGACANCPSSPITADQFVGAKLRELVWPDLVVEVVEE